MTAVYFEGNAPRGDSSVFSASDIFQGLLPGPSLYYLPGTTGLGATFGLLPTVLWDPQVQTGNTGFGVRTNHFGFSITGTNGLIIVVEASTNLANPTWTPLATNVLTNGSAYFSDPEWTNYPARFYRLRWP